MARYTLTIADSPNEATPYLKGDPDDGTPPPGTDWHAMENAVAALGLENYDDFEIQPIENADGMVRVMMMTQEGPRWL